jgi:hypothetical protein
VSAAHALAWQSLGKVIDVSTETHSRQDWDAKLAELHETLVASVEALVIGNEWKHALEFAAHFRTRSFNNTLLIGRSTPPRTNAGLFRAPSRPTSLASNSGRRSGATWSLASRRT